MITFSSIKVSFSPISVLKIDVFKQFISDFYRDCLFFNDIKMLIQQFKCNICNANVFTVYRLYIKFTTKPPDALSTVYLWWNVVCGVRTRSLIYKTNICLRDFVKDMYNFGYKNFQYINVVNNKRILEYWRVNKVYFDHKKRYKKIKLKCSLNSLKKPIVFSCITM